MGDRLTPEQRRVDASLMEVYGSPTVVRQKFAEQFADEIHNLSVNIILTNPVYGAKESG
jgi:hypothetical protein